MFGDVEVARALIQLLRAVSFQFRMLVFGVSMWVKVKPNVEQ